jgi:hypothetical protein
MNFSHLFFLHRLYWSEIKDNIECNYTELKNMTVQEFIDVITVIMLQSDKHPTSNKMLLISLIVAVSTIFILILFILFAFLSGIVKFNKKAEEKNPY